MATGNLEANVPSQKKKKPSKVTERRLQSDGQTWNGWHCISGGQWPMDCPTSTYPPPLSICTHFMAFVMQTHCWTNFNYLKRLLGKLETSVTADHFARGRNHCHWTGNTELMPKQCFKFEANKIERSLFMGVRSVKTNEARNSNKTNGCRGIWRKTQTLEIQA